MSPANGPVPVAGALWRQLVGRGVERVVDLPARRIIGTVDVLQPRGDAVQRQHPLCRRPGTSRRPAPATDADASTSPATATTRAACDAREPAAAPRRDITATSGARTQLSLRLLIACSLPHPSDRSQRRMVVPRDVLWAVPASCARRSRTGSSRPVRTRPAATSSRTTARVGRTGGRGQTSFCSARSGSSSLPCRSCGGAEERSTEPSALVSVRRVCCSCWERAARSAVRSASADRRPRPTRNPSRGPWPGFSCNSCRRRGRSPFCRRLSRIANLGRPSSWPSRAC